MFINIAARPFLFPEKSPIYLYIWGYPKIRLLQILESLAFSNVALPSSQTGHHSHDLPCPLVPLTHQRSAKAAKLN